MQKRQCRECRRLWKAYRFGLAQKCRLDRNMMAALQWLDLPNFEAFSRALTTTEAILALLRRRLEAHQTGHRPCSGPLPAAE